MNYKIVCLTLAFICLSTSTFGAEFSRRQKQNAVKECKNLFARMKLGSLAKADVAKIMEPKDIAISQLRRNATAYGGRYLMIPMKVAELRKMVEETPYPDLWKEDEATGHLLFDNLFGKPLKYTMLHTYAFSTAGMAIAPPEGWNAAFVFDLSILDRPDIELKADYEGWAVVEQEGRMVHSNVVPANQLVGGESSEAAYLLRLLIYKFNHDPSGLKFQFKHPIPLSQATALWIPKPVLLSGYLSEEKLRNLGGFMKNIEIWQDFSTFPEYGN